MDIHFKCAKQFVHSETWVMYITCLIFVSIWHVFNLYSRKTTQEWNLMLSWHEHVAKGSAVNTALLHQTIKVLVDLV